MGDKATEKKERIVAAFMELVKEFGIEKITLVDIARKCGITKSGIYYYFNSKEDVILAGMDLVAVKIAELIARELEKCKSPTDKLKAYLNLRMRMFKHDERLVPKFFQNMSSSVISEMQKFVFSSPLLVDSMIKIHNEEKNFIADLLSKILNPALPKDKLEEKAAILLNFMVGYFHMAKKTEDMMDEYKKKINVDFYMDDKTLPDVVEFLVNGVIGKN